MSVELVGILNVTPDSFSDGGKFLDPQTAITRAGEMFAAGATIVDIGAEATNPFVDEAISVEEELSRLIPVVSKLLPAHEGLRFSIDTRHPEVVTEAAKYGQFMVNDVTTFSNPDMIDVTAKLNLWAIASHLPLEARGDIQFAHEILRMSNIDEVVFELIHQVELMTVGGIVQDKIIIDPGIGFAKSNAVNWDLVKRFIERTTWAANALKWLGRQPIMYGVSRKRFLATDSEAGMHVEGVDRNDPAKSTKVMEAIIESNKKKRRLLFRVHDVAAHKLALDGLVAKKRLLEPNEANVYEDS